MVGLTEIKLKADQSFSPNFKIPGYSFTFQPSLSNAGGDGFYIKESGLSLIFQVGGEMKKIAGGQILTGPPVR